MTTFEEVMKYAQSINVQDEIGAEVAVAILVAQFPNAEAPLIRDVVSRLYNEAYN